MTGNVIVIPAKPQMTQQIKRQLRVAAYCRVSTGSYSYGICDNL